MEHKLCQGFKAAGIASGIKKRGGNDLGLIYSESLADAAAVFTKNKIQAAPVQLDRERLKSGKCQAVIVNSGNANCCTGNQGMEDAKHMTFLAASNLNISVDFVLAASTGVIGEKLPVEKIEAKSQELVLSLSVDGLLQFAEAIMTTDTFPKIISKQGQINGQTFTITGVAKGSGMIKPNMATLLCFVCTDVKMNSDLLYDSLLRGVDFSFNRISVDGDTSTNDTVLIMANGFSGVKIQEKQQQDIFQNVLNDVLIYLAKSIAKDGEGATKLIEIVVKGANSDKDAAIIADTVSNSNLVKTAMFGEDANWGRILAAVGRSGVQIIPDKIDVYFDEVLMVKSSMAFKGAESMASKVLKKPEFTIEIDLNMGKGKASMFTCDFSLDYVKINADYRS